MHVNTENLLRLAGTYILYFWSPVQNLAFLLFCFIYFLLAPTDLSYCERSSVPIDGHFACEVPSPAVHLLITRVRRVSGEHTAHTALCNPAQSKRTHRSPEPQGHQIRHRWCHLFHQHPPPLPSMTRTHFGIREPDTRGSAGRPCGGSLARVVVLCRPFTVSPRHFRHNFT